MGREYKNRARHRRSIRRYWRLRNAGLSSYEAKARMRGTTPEAVRAADIERSRRYRQKWGGDPKFGSEAFNRREITRFLEATEGSARPLSSSAEVHTCYEGCTHDTPDFVEVPSAPGALTP